MTRLSIDYGPGTIAYKRGQLDLARDRHDARLVRRTNIGAGVLAAFFMATLLVVQVLPAMGVIQ